MASKITLKQYHEIKNKTYTMVSYNIDTMKRFCTTTSDMISLMEYQMIRPDLGHLIMENETYCLIPLDIKYSNELGSVKEIIAIAMQHRKV